MRKILGILAIGLMGLSVVSCEDFLDVTSENQMLLDDFYKSAEECRAATALGILLTVVFTLL